MNTESLTAKLLDLVEGRETPESWRNWWDEHEPELETLLSRGEFLKLKPCRHGFQWVPVFGSQKGAIAILEKSGTAFEASNLYQERYLAELDAFCKEQKRVQREKQKEFKASHPELFGRYPKFSKALAKVLDPSDEIKPATTEEQIGNQESVMDFTLPAQVREFFLLTAGINVFTGVIVELRRRISGSGVDLCEFLGGSDEQSEENSKVSFVFWDTCSDFSGIVTGLLSKGKFSRGGNAAA